MDENIDNKKILVTGGAGFIGSHLTDRLIRSKKNYVTVYDNLSSGKKGFIAHHLTKPNFKFIKADLLDFRKLKKEIKNHNIVFHLSANPDIQRGIKNTKLDLEQETIATYNVLEAMRQNNIKKIIFASSSAIYGEAFNKLIKEDYGPILPISLYGAGKAGSEALISAFCGTFNFQAWIFRFANVVGNRATHGVILDFINKLKKNPKELEILGNGKQVKPYIWVGDCVDGILHGLRKSKNQINVFNLGVNDSVCVNNIAKMVVKEMDLRNVKFNYTGGDRGWPGDIPRFRYNISKMKKLGWQAKYNSQEAVRKTIQFLIEEI